MSSKKIQNYFAGANSYRGFYSLYDYLPFNCQRKFIIKGGPGTGKSTFMKKTAEQMLEQGYKIEKFWCSSDSQSLDGIVIKELETSFIDGTAPHLVDPKYPGVIGEIINLGRYWDRDILLANKSEIISLTKENKEFFVKTYQKLKEAHEYFERQEAIYNNNLMAELKAEFIDYVIKTIDDKGTKKKETLRSRHLFATALTPIGLIDYTSEIIEQSEKMIMIKVDKTKGSNLLKKAGKIAKNRGHQVLYFHSSFIPELVELIKIEDLNLLIINDSSDSGFKSIELMKIFNFERRMELSEQLEKRASLLEEEQKNKINEAVDYLKQAKEIHDLLEDKYIKAMDFTQIEARREKIIEELTTKS